MIWLFIVIALICGLVILGSQLSAFHLLAYNGNLSNANSIDLSANTDPEIGQRNGHYVLTENYQILAAAAVGNTLTEANLLCPTLNQVTKFNVYPGNVTTTQLSPPRVDFYTHAPIALPMYEELQFQMNASGSDTVGGIGLLMIGTTQWKRGARPQGIGPIPIFTARFTCTPTGNSRNWSSLVTITFEQSLLHGTYAMVGCDAQGTNLIAFRIVFPQAPQWQGRRLRPGWLASNTYGDILTLAGDIGPLVWGTWGQFTTFEPFQFEALMEGSASTTVQGIMRLVRVSEDVNVNYSNMP